MRKREVSAAGVTRIVRHCYGHAQDEKGLPRARVRGERSSQNLEAARSGRPCALNTQACPISELITVGARHKRHSRLCLLRHSRTHCGTDSREGSMLEVSRMCDDPEKSFNVILELESVSRFAWKVWGNGRRGVGGELVNMVEKRRGRRREKKSTYLGRYKRRTGSNFLQVPSSPALCLFPWRVCVTVAGVGPSRVGRRDAVAVLGTVNLRFSTVQALPPTPHLQFCIV
ncbi:hypothetical protein C8R46DRAFT_1028279 [Mycena filopes]|nr:hypothetical protein C8R46DRAFT_1028279 [Mycena filopes]